MNEIISEILSSIFIGVGVVYFHKNVAASLDERQFMEKTMFLILFIMVMLFVADKLFLRIAIYYQKKESKTYLK
jgi:hypothetical protein